MKKFKLTMPQKSIYDLESFGGKLLSTIGGAFFIRGKLDQERMTKALNLVIKNNDAYRLKFLNTDEGPVQYIDEFKERTFRSVDFDYEQEYRNWIADYAKTPILENDGMFEFIMVDLTDHFGIVLRTSHMISDDWGMFLCKKMIMQYYEELQNGTLIDSPNENSYVHFMESEEKYYNSGRFVKDKEYWNRILKQYNTPTNFSLKTTNDLTTERIIMEADEGIQDMVTSYCTGEGVSEFTLLMAAFGLLTQKRTKLDDIYILTTLANRTAKADKGALGMYVNTIPVHFVIDQSITVRDYLKAASASIMDTFRYRKYNYNLILEDAYQNKITDKISDIYFSFLNTVNPEHDNELYFETFHTGVQIESLNFIARINAEHKLEFNYYYHSDVFEEWEIKTLNKSYNNILRHMIRNDSLPVSAVAAYDENEFHLVKSAFNDTDRNYPSEKTIVQLFEDQVKQTPNRTAVVFENETLTYEQLNKRANSLARKIRAAGVICDDAVAIIAERSLELVVGILGVLKSGAAYVPIDPMYPLERIGYLLNDCSPKVVLTYLPQENIGISDYLLIDLGDQAVFNGDSENLTGINSPKDLAYIIYTSGTTGEPKGVMVQHSSVVNFCSNSDKNVMYHALSNGYTKIASVTNISFDIFVTEIWLSFLNGMTTFVANRLEQDDPEHFSDYVLKNDIQILQTTPSRIRLLIADESKTKGFKNLKYIMLGGEKVEAGLIVSLRNVTDAVIANVYGPAETTVWSTIGLLSAPGINDRITIGKPVSNTQVYIISEGKFCSIGEPGELCIAGDGLSRGYLNKPELTAEKFIKNPYGTGRLYRTGDLARWLPGGELEFLGRIDTQVKIRGFRIELEEIQNVLREISYMKDAVVIARENHNGDMELHGYVIAEEEVDIRGLQSEISKKLPEYMVPRYLMQIDRLPLNRNGKLDQKMLPNITMVSSNQYIAPRNEAETVISQIFKEVLAVERVGATDSFFELGGDSIKAALVVSKAAMKGYKLNAGKILSLKTVENIAVDVLADVSNQLSTAASEISGEVPEPEQLYPEYEKVYGLTPVQQGILYHYIYEASVGDYFMQSVIKSNTEIHLIHVMKALNLLAVKHEVLRTQFIYEEGREPWQAISGDIEIECELKSITAESELEALCAEEIKRGFDLKSDSLMRVTVVSIDHQNKYFIWNIHHLISDGWSNAIFFRDFNEIYQALAGGEKYSLLRSKIQSEAKKSAHFSDYIRFLKSIDQKKSLEYWKVLLFGYEGNGEIIPAGDAESGREVCGVASKNIDRDLQSALTKASRSLGVTQNTMFESALGLLIQKYTGTSDVVFGKVISGRNGEIPDIEQVAGVFINVIPVRISADDDDSLANIVTNTSEQFFRSMEHGYCSIADIQSDTSQKNNLIKVLFAFENYFGNEEFSQREEYEFMKNREQTNYDLAVTVKLSKFITLEVMYDQQKYSQLDGELLVERYYHILKCMAEDIHTKYKDLSLKITEKEWTQVLIPYNQSREELRSGTLHQLFMEQAEKTPDLTAVICYGETITYGQLLKKAAQTANYILSSGVTAKSNIAISGERNIGTIINILGILMAGCSYVPLNPEYPEERNKYIAASSGSKLVLPADVDMAEKISRYSSVLNTVAHEPENRAYTIYTSGSTGVPKGVVIKHSAAVNTIVDINQKFQITSADRIIGLSSFSFDLSVYDVFGALSTGAALILVNDQRDMWDIKTLIMKHEVTFWNSVPAIMSMFLEAQNEDFKNTSLRHVLLSGDWIPLTLPDAIKSVFTAAAVTSLGGATEGSIWSIYYPICEVKKSWRSIPYGRPLANQNMYILDEGLKICPVGISGQISIGGKGVAEEYANDSEKTKKAFINHQEFGKIYLTGDMGRMKSDGNIEFLGRMDDQVKIRGFRIELGEIEHVIRAIHSVKEAIVIARQLGDASQELNAYLVSDDIVETRQIQSEIRKKLPDYMVPPYIMQIDKIPVTSNGKIDKKALPQPKYSVAADSIAPRTAAEETVVKAFETVLDLDQVSVTSSFFELGGHSLKATKLSNEIEKMTGVKIAIKDIFSNPTAELLAAKIKSAEDHHYQPVAPVGRAESYLMSSPQKRLFLLEEMMGSGIGYNISSVLRIKGRLDLRALQKALNKLVEAEEILRTSFHMINDAPVQKIAEHAEITIDYREIQEFDLEKTFKQFVRPFDLGKAPLMRMMAVKTPADSYLLCDIHHIVSDGESMLIMLNKLSALYEGKEIEKLQVQYKDFTAWQRSKDIEEQARYWQQEFAGELPILDLKTDYIRPMVQSYEGTVLKYPMKPDTREKVRALAENYKATEFMVMLSAFMVMLSKYSRQNEMIVGIPVSGRTHADTHSMLGMFVNTLALKGEPDQKESFGAFLKKIREKCLKAYDNQEYQFEDLVDAIDIQRERSRNPVFDVMFEMQNIRDTNIKLGNLEAEYVQCENNISKFDITLSINDTESGYSANFEYCTDLFERDTIVFMAKHYSTLVEQILTNPETKISQLCMADEAEQQLILQDFNNTCAVYDHEKTAVQLFEEQVEKTPDHTAIVYDGKSLTYQELNHAANGLAEKLRAEYGIKADDLVAVLAERSLEMMIGIFGILKAGGAYLPIDPKYPEERIRYILKDSKAKVLIGYKTDIETDLICLDLAGERLRKGRYSNPVRVNKPTDLAYCIYTSGTTGNPKGVMLEHKGIPNMVEYFRKIHKLSERDRVLQFASIAFDTSVSEIVMSLFNGAGMYIISDEDRYDPEKLKAFIERNKITVATIPPAMLENTDIEGLRLLISAGAETNKELVEKNRKAAVYSNDYGPTEATVVSSYWRHESAEDVPARIPIGKPLINKKIYIIDGDTLCGIGVPGELCIAGVGLARGYFNQPELTAEKFVNNPYGEGRMYRSGDLARWLPDGNIEFLGRMDEQVKIRGFRIELGEIENRLKQVAAIKEAAVIVQTDHSGEKNICAYVVSHDFLDRREIKAELQNSLPDYMIPAHIMQIPFIPLTRNGKLDKKALPEPEYKNTELFVGAGNKIEEKIISVFQAVLGERRISMTDGFFELGGDSIKAIRTVSKLREQGLNTSVKDIIKGQTPENIAKTIRRSVNAMLTEQGEVSGEVLLTAIQSEFFRSGPAKPNYFNQSIAFACEEKIDILRLARVLSKLTEHHDLLRAYYKNGVQTIGRIGEKQWYGLREFECSVKDIERYSQELQESMRLEDGVLMKVGLFHTPEKDYLVVVIHHLVVDGVSWRIISEDLENGYRQAKQNIEIQLPDKTSSYQVWSNEVSKYRNHYMLAREIEYWEKINREIEMGMFPQDGNKKEDCLRTSRIQLGTDDTNALLKRSSNAYHTEINALLLTALSRAVNCITGQTHLSLEMEGHGREEIISGVNIERTVGWFTSIYPVVLKDIGKDMEQDIRNVKENLRRIPNKGIGYGILKEIGEPAFTKVIKPEITFNYLGEFRLEQGDSNPIFLISSIKRGNDIEASNLFNSSININGFVEAGMFTIEIMYNESHYQAETMERLGSELEKQLAAVSEHCRNIKKPQYTASDFGEYLWSDEEFKAAEEKLNSRSEVMKRIYPLTAMQEGMLFEKLSNESSTQYVIQQAVRFANLNVACMQMAFEALVNKHDILRTIIKHKGVTVPRQILLKARKPESTYLEITGEGEYESIKAADIKRGFDLEEDSLIRMMIVKISDSDYRMIQTSHHIIMDGWCLSILFGDLFKYYQLLKDGFEIPQESAGVYENFVRYIEAKDKDKSLSYWESLLENYHECADILPFGNKTMDIPTEESCKKTISLSKELTAKAEQLCTACGVTVNTLVEAVWGILLQRYNGSNDVVFGKVVSGRNASVDRIEEMIGLFINTIPVRIKTAPGDTLKSLLDNLRRQALESADHDYCSLAEIQNKSPLGSGLIGTIMAFENYYTADNALKDGKLFGVSAELESSREQTNYDITLSAYTSDTLHLGIEYVTKKYGEVQIGLLLLHLQTAFETLVNHPEAEIKTLQMFGRKEEQRLIEDFNNTSSEYPCDQTVIQLFEAQVEKTPDSVCVIYGKSPSLKSADGGGKSPSLKSADGGGKSPSLKSADGGGAEQFTYGEINSYANKIACKLLKAGVKTGEFVGILAEKSAMIIPAMLGILKVGAAYLPLDPKNPDSRQNFIIRDSACRVVLSAEDKGLEHLGVPVLLLNDSNLNEECDRNPGIQGNADDLAYLMYTSGTTGNPKGVMVRHKNIVRLVKNTNYVKFEEIRTLLTGSLTFDACTFEIWGPLLNGGAVALAESEVLSDPDLLYQSIDRYRINSMFLTTALFNQLVSIKPDVFDGLTQLLVGGEKMTAHHAQMLRRHNRQLSFSNLYGPTESTTYALFYPIGDEVPAPVPIGKPISNTTAYVMEGNCLCGIGMPGELCLGGDGIAAGYLNQPELTEQKFIENPFDSGGVLYRTGDLARWLPDGTIEYLGRIDEQVKIRGFRIELGEIESALRKISDLKDAVVVAKEMPDGDCELHGYFVANREIDIRDIQKELRKMLPGYMIPGYFMQLDVIPVTGNGKQNKKALPEITAAGFGEYAAPGTKTEAAVAEIFEEILKLDHVGVNSNFFEIGGHSLKATYLINKIESVAGVHLTLKTFFENPTVAGISEIIDTQSKADYVPIDRAAEREYYPMSSAQKRIFIIQDIDHNGVSYNMPAQVVFSKRIDPEKLRNAFAQLILRHESLRTSFHMMDGQAVQKIAENAPSEISYLKSVDHANSEKMITTFIQPFDLSKAPLMRLKLIDFADSFSMLLFDVHHIISDGVSQEIIIKELAALYNDNILPEQTVQYKDYSEWMDHRDLSSQRQYWIDQFSDPVEAIDIPLDYPRPKIQSFKGRRLSCQINRKMADKVLACSKKHGSTEYMILLSVFAVMLNKYSGQDDLVIGTPVSGRTHRDTEQIIGMFVNTLALRCHPSGDKLFSGFLEEVTQTCLNAYDNQDYPFEKIVEEMEQTRDMGRNPLFDMMFAVKKAGADSVTFEDSAYQIVAPKGETAKFDITAELIQHENGYTLEFEYRTDLFKAETIQEMMKQFILILDQALTDEDMSLSELTTLLPEQEKMQLVTTFNSTEREYPSDQTVIKLFEEQVKKNPDKPAVIFEGETLSYRQLNEKANALAVRLTELGVRHNDFVALLAERSTQVIVAMISILKAGAVYVPIDPQYPTERVGDILKDCCPKVTLIYDADIMVENTVIDLADPAVFEEDRRTDAPSGRQPQGAGLAVPGHYSDLAYVIYTSGTTGKPKGVMVEHRNILRLVKNTNYVDLNAETVILQTGAISFDASTFEIWGSLLNGGTLCLSHKYTLQSPEVLQDVIRNNGVNTVFITTALFNQLISYDSGFFSSVKYLLFGGEQTSEQSVDAFMNNPANHGVRFANVYGPTEATTFSLYYPIGRNHPQKTPIGKPISNSKAYIMQNGRLCSIGQKGELCLGGDGIARGYLNNQELTAEKFIGNPFGPGKIYRSGDLARWLPDGNIEFLGRTDDQVKIRGFRIELGEIESVIKGLGYIKDIVVHVTEGQSGDKELNAYLVSDQQVDIKKLQQDINSRLPDYMVPRLMMQIDRIPVSRNGKTDKKALPKISITSLNEYVAPVTEHEQIVCEIYRDVLGVAKVSVTDSLYELGGDSIKAIRIVSKLREKGYEISMKELLSADHVRSLASYLTVNNAVSAYDQGEINGKVKATPTLYQFKEFSLKYPEYFHQALLLESKEAIDRTALEMALATVVRHHDILRAVYDGDSLVIKDCSSSAMFEIHCRHLTGKHEIKEVCTALQAGYDLAAGPMLKAGIITVSDNQYLFICIHHLVVDTVSWKILLEDLLNAYGSIRKKQPVKLPQKTISFKDWAEYLEEYAKSIPLKTEVTYWRNIANRAKSIEINFGDMEISTSGCVSTVLDAEQTSNLLYHTRKAFNTEVRDILLAALAVALKRWRNFDEVTIMLEGHGREELHESVRNDRTVGWFTSIYPILLRGCESHQDTIVTTKEMLRKIPNSGMGYGIIKYLTTEKMADINSMITWNYHGIADEGPAQNSVMQPVADIDTGDYVHKDNKYLTPFIMELMIVNDSLCIDLIYQDVNAAKEAAVLSGLYRQAIEELIHDCMGSTIAHKTLSDFELGDIEISDADEINQLVQDLF